MLLFFVVLLVILVVLVGSTAFFFYCAGFVLPGVHVDDFGSALRASISFTIWRLLLLVPAVLLIISGTVGLPAEVASRNFFFAYAVTFMVDGFALYRAEQSAYGMRIDGLLPRVGVIAVMSLVGVGLQLSF